MYLFFFFCLKKNVFRFVFHCCFFSIICLTHITVHKKQKISIIINGTQENYSVCIMLQSIKTFWFCFPALFCCFKLIFMIIKFSDHHHHNVSSKVLFNQRKKKYSVENDEEEEENEQIFLYVNYSNNDYDDDNNNIRQTTTIMITMIIIQKEELNFH